MAPRRYAKPTSGIRTWHSRDALTRAKRWAGSIAVALLVLALLWLTGLTDDEGIDGELVLGLVMLELFTLIPAAYAANRWRALRRLLRHADTIDEDELEAEAASLEAADEVRWRIGRLVDTLSPGAARDAGLDGLRAAEDAAETRQRLVRRRAELERLSAVTGSKRTKASLTKAISACDRQLSEGESAMEELAQRVAELVEMADSDRASAELRKLHDAVERTSLFTESLAEVGSLTSKQSAR